MMLFASVYVYYTADNMNAYSSMTDEELVPLCKMNEREAWTELYSRYKTVSRTLALKFAGNGNEIDDLIQEGLLGFLAAVHSYRADIASFKTYAWQCMRNRIINVVASSKTKKSVPTDMCYPLEEQIDLADDAKTPEEQVIIKNEAQRIFDAISQVLSEGEGAAFKLYLSGYTYEEIALRLNISRKAVDGALQRARKKLKAEIGKSFE